MPSLTASLAPTGALVQALINVSGPRQAAMEKAGKPLPEFAKGTFLVDTGASVTCVDPRLMAPLSITPSGVVSMQTPSTNGAAVACNQYDVAIYIPGAESTQGLFIAALPVLETNLSAHGIDGLIGRDIIDRCVLIYNGSLKTLTLSY